MKRIWVSRYELKPTLPRSARVGALLKIEFEDGTIGYADLHPWQEFGDLALADELARLCGGDAAHTKLSRRSFALAKADAKARAERRSVFSGLQIPESHFLFTSVDGVSADSLVELKNESYRAAKVKVGKDLVREKEILEAAFSNDDVREAELKLRLDFNSALSEQAAADWLLDLSEDLNDAIEFCEDPCSFDAKAWSSIQRQTGVELVRDMGSEQSLGDENVSGLIVKPAVQDPSVFLNSSQNIFVTSYLDHPIGQLGAAYEAGRLAKKANVGVCGLLSHSSYHANAYSEEFPSVGPRFVPDLRDHGIGMTDLLENENWEILV